MVASWLVTAVLAIGVVAGARTLAVFKSQSEKRRTARFTEVAGALGLTYSETPPPDFTIEPIRSFKLFTQGKPRGIEQVMRGQPYGYSLAVFDYVYVWTLLGVQLERRRPVPIECTVVWHWSPALRLPRFRVHPKGLDHAIGEIVGYPSVDLPGQPYFSDAYVLQGDPSVANVFGGQLAAYLERLHLDHVDVAIEGGGGQVLCYSWQRRVAGDDLREFVDHTIAVITMLHARR